MILSPVVKGRKGEYHRLFERLMKKGFLRARVNGRMRELEDEIVLEKTKKHAIEVLIDEAEIEAGSRKRVREAVEKALEPAGGELLVIGETGEENYYSLRLLCPQCGVSLPALEPRNFSFNSPYGACPGCHGLGYRTRLDEWGEIEFTDEVCPECGGTRLKKESLTVTVGGKNIFEMNDLPAGKLAGEFQGLKFEPAQQIVASRIIKEILSQFLHDAEPGQDFLDDP